MKKIATGNPSFPSLIKNDFVYVDKTKYIYDLLEKGDKFFFISRPRRFGKSLFCSTLEALFKGERDLFEGLYIDSTDYAFTPYPVLHFDFSNFETRTNDDFLAALENEIKKTAAGYGVKIKGQMPSLMLDNLINDIYYQEGKEVVMIIDEFDSPVIDSLDKPTLSFIKEVFQNFYATVKKNTEKIRFFFMTGITKLSNMSIFSKMNNLVDLSMDDDFASLFGYTDDELDEYFSFYLEECFERNKETYPTYPSMLDAIRTYYDGYRFSDYSNVSVYNPVSIGYFITNKFRFQNYWELTGLSTLAVKLAKRYKLSELVMEEQLVSKSIFTSFDVSLLADAELSKKSVLALLYYTGYLTIRKALDGGVALGFPNMEISSSFTESLALLYSDDSSETGDMIIEGKEALNKGETGKLVEALSEFYSNCSSQIIRERLENPYHLIFHMFFVALGARISSEEGTLKGRIDTVVEKKNTIYIAELKVDESAEKALAQIKEKGYGEKYKKKAERLGKRLHLLGINFSSKERMISDWMEEIL